MFSTLESQGIRSDILWGIWTIHPDGTNWNPLVSAFDPGGAPNGFHFQTQLSDGSIVVEEYYNQNNSGFGAYVKLPPSPPRRLRRAFGPALHERPAQQAAGGSAGTTTASRKWYRMPFMPTGSVSLTPFAHRLRRPGRPLDPRRQELARGRQVHASLRRAGQSPADGLLARAGQSSVHVPAAARRRHLPDQERRSRRRAGPDAAHQERSELQRVLAAGRRAVRAHLRHRRAGEPAARWPTTASCRSTCRRGRRSAWSARRASTSARAIPTAACPKGKVTATYAGGNDPWKGLDAVHQPRQRHAAQLAQPGGRRRACTRTTTSTPSASWRWSRRPTATAAPSTAGGSTTTPASGCGSWARSRCASSIPASGRSERPAARSRRQPRHQLPGQDPGRRGVHVPDARQATAWC